MSYASECKLEILNIKRTPAEEKSMFFGMYDACYREGKNYVFKTSSEDIIKKYIEIYYKLYKDKLPYSFNEGQKLFETKHQNLDNAEELDVVSYLGGLFVARGSVNDPETTKYHFEITVFDPKVASRALVMINKKSFEAKIIFKNNRRVIYIKDAEKIVDILRFLGASEKAFAFEDIRIQRDFSNSINRLINCELANEEKSIKAARDQLRYIKYLEYNYPLEKLDPKILTVMKVRKDNPDASLNEMRDILEKRYGFKLSKSGLMHYITRIKNIAIEDNKKQNS